LEQLGRNDLSLSKQFRLRHLWLRDLPARRLWKYRQDLLYLYDACIAGIDSQVGRLLEALENRDNFSNTIIVLTADHGEAFLERGERYHYPVSAAQEIIRVPLLIRLPSGNLAINLISQPFGLIDLLPTVLDIAGLACPSCFTGRSRWPALKSGEPWDDPAITEMIYNHNLNPLKRINPPGYRLVAATEEGHKLIMNFEIGTGELFNLKEDPCELQGRELLYNSRVSKKLLGALSQHLEEGLHNRHSRPELLLRLERLRELVSGL
jgi:arylsulfatase A-like enzyme